MRLLLLSLLFLAGCAAQGASAPSPAVVIAAERAFAARAGEIGWVPAFREYVAPDGQLAQAGGFVDAPSQLAESPDDGNRTLFWWPAFAGIARSGDLGFTTGPVSLDLARTPRGHYFTVWRRQGDGSWKWIYDGGVGPIANPGLIAPDASEVPTLAVEERGVGALAAKQVRALEGELNGADSLRARLAPEAQVFRSRLPRGVGADMAAALTAPAEDVSYALERVEASAAGDMVMTLGRARWTGGEGLYARIWQYRSAGWAIVYDQLILPRPPPG